MYIWVGPNATQNRVTEKEWNREWNSPVPRQSYIFQVHTINKPESFQPSKASQTFQYFEGRFIWKKPFLTEKPLQIWQDYFWTKSSFCRKAIAAKKPFLAKSLIKFNQVWSFFDRSDPPPKKTSHFYPFCKRDNFL